MFHVTDCNFKIISTFEYLWEAKEFARKFDDGEPHFVFDRTGQIVAGF